MPTSIVIACGDKPLSRELHRAVRGHAVRVAVHHDGTRACARMADEPPDLLILDGSVLGADPGHLCWRLRQHPRTRAVPILMLTSGAASEELEALHMGADRCVPKPLDAAYLQAHVASLLLRSRAVIDVNPLTRLPGNRAIEAEVNRRLSARESFWLYYVDIRHFKEFNDAYGFAAGDGLIRRVAGIVCDATRTSHGDFVGHIGGDDFVAVCDEAVDADAMARRFLLESRESLEPRDRIRGYLRGADREGDLRDVELPRLTVGRIYCPPGFCRSFAEVSFAATRLKQSAKSRPFAATVSGPAREPALRA